MKTIHFRQATSSRSPDSNSISLSVDQMSSRQTITGKVESEYLSIGGNMEFLEPARSLLGKIANHEHVKTAENLLGKIETIMTEFIASGVDASNIPKLYGYLAKDSAILLEWTSEKFRAGVSIEPDEADSGWYLITDRDLGDVSTSGHLALSDAEPVLRELIRFVIKNT